MISDEELRMRAYRRAQVKTSFYGNLTAYVLVNVALFLIWYYLGGGFPWFLFVVFFWGIGVLAQGISIYFGSSYMERMTEAEYRKMKGGRY